MKEIRDGLHLYYCGYEACKALHSFGPAVRQHYLMHFVLKGEGIYCVGDRTISVKPGSAFLIRPGEVTYYQADANNPWEYIWIAFDGADAERLIRDHQINEKTLNFSFHDSELISHYLQSFLKVFTLGKNAREESMGYFYLIWSQLERPDQVMFSAGEDTYLSQSKKYIRHHFTYPIKVEEIANFIGIDRTYLYRIFLKYEHCSPKQYLTDCRINAAKEMMLNNSGRLNLTEIALSSGFHDSASFSRQFKKQVGTSPMKWLQKHADHYAESQLSIGKS